MPKPFNPNKDYGEVRGHPERFYAQNGWYYDYDGNPIEEQVVGKPSRMVQQILEQKKKSRVRLNLGRIDPESVVPESIRRARKENAAARAAEESAE